MKYRTAGVLIIVLFSAFSTYAQEATYNISKTSFSLDGQDEFAPAWYKNSLVFCANKNTGLTEYTGYDNKGLFKLFIVSPNSKGRWLKPKIFSSNLTTRLNDGPATFNSTFDTIYYSRNIRTDDKLRELSGIRNKLGIFSAVYEEGKWGKIREFRFNNEWFNISTPSLTPDGKRLYFTSDNPGGYGGSDIYYSNWKDGYWDNPVNLGSVINTSGNESYPFANTEDGLFFSSDGHNGLGGKDIFYSEYKDSLWLPPVLLDSPINSETDDFGLITDELMEEGYYSSNRNSKSLDIFHFVTNYQQQFYSTEQKENNYCYRFTDDGTINIDSASLFYEWDFNDGEIAEGDTVMHCFPGPGKYLIQQKIADKITREAFFIKESNFIEIRDIEQPYIYSVSGALAGDSILFDGTKSNFKDYSIIRYDWNFGDGQKADGGKVYHEFTSSGDYDVKLGLILKNHTTGSIKRASAWKRITVCGNSGDLASFLKSQEIREHEYPDFTRAKNILIAEDFSAKSYLAKGAVFLLEVINSPTSIKTDSSYFEALEKKYFIKEIPDTNNRVFHYIICEEKQFSDIYFLYRDVVNMGYKNSKVLLYLYLSPAEKELSLLKEIYGTSADAFFFKNSYRISSFGIAFLDQIALLMKKYPHIRMFIGTHSDNSGSSKNNLMLSKQRSQAMVSYLVEKGVNINNLIYKGFGDIRPLALNNSEVNRKKNSRVEFMIAVE